MKTEPRLPHHLRAHFADVEAKILEVLAWAAVNPNPNPNPHPNPNPNPSPSPNPNPNPSPNPNPNPNPNPYQVLAWADGSPLHGLMSEYDAASEASGSPGPNRAKVAPQLLEPGSSRRP